MKEIRKALESRPLLSLTVLVNERRELRIEAKRHGVDAVELMAAAGFTAAQIMNLVVQMIAQGARPTLPIDNSHPPSEPPEPRRLTEN